MPAPLISAFQGQLSKLLAVTGVSVPIVIPPGYRTLCVSMLGVVADDIVWSENAATPLPTTAGGFVNGKIVQRGTVQTFEISDSGGTWSFSAFGAGGTIGLTLGNGF